MSRQIVTAAPTALELGPEVIPLAPQSILSGTPVTRIKHVVRSHDLTEDILVWECTAGIFTWNYRKDETIVVVSGEVYITNEKGEERRLGPGDLAFFPAGSSCQWRVPVRVRKIAVEREALWKPLGFGWKAWKKLLRIAGVGRQSSLS
jgi:uncharacterized cupin superfamily protein